VEHTHSTWVKIGGPTPAGQKKTSRAEYRNYSVHKCAWSAIKSSSNLYGILGIRILLNFGKSLKCIYVEYFTKFE